MIIKISDLYVGEPREVSTKQSPSQSRYGGSSGTFGHSTSTPLPSPIRKPSKEPGTTVSAADKRTSGSQYLSPTTAVASGNFNFCGSINYPFGHCMH